MATQEEILLRVGLDGSGFDSNIDKTENRLDRFAHKGHDSFVHVAGPARAFHHLLGEISSRAPLLAEGLESLVNPTTGAIALVGAGFGLAMEKMKEFNKTMDEVSASNAKAIDLNKEGLSELAREEREFRKGLGIDPVTGITKAVGEEKDPSTKLSQARQNRDRFAAERNARLQELKQLREQERRLTVLPSLIRETQDVMESLQKAPHEFQESSVQGPFGLKQVITDVTQDRLNAFRDRISRFKAELGTPDRLKEISLRRQQLESEVRERSKAIGELQDIIDPLAPHDVLPRGRRGGSFRISGPGGTFSGTVGNDAQEIKTYLKQIAESPWVKDGKIQVPNGK